MMDRLTHTSKTAFRQPVTRSVAVCLLAASFILLAWSSSLYAAEKSSDISSRLSREQQQLQDARQELDLLSRTITDQTVIIDASRAQLADATTRLSEAEDRYNESLDRFSDRIAEIYKMGESRYFEAVFSSDSFNDMVTRFEYLGIISESDRQLVDELKAEETHVRAMRERVSGLKQESMLDINDLKLRQSQLEQEIVTTSARVQQDTVALEEAVKKEAEEEARRFAELSYSLDHDFSFSGAIMGPSVLVGSEPPPGMIPSGIVMTGMASWYGPGFHGNTTANGEIYNQMAMTAAHKSLPFGTWLKVTFNGRSVFVRINDRGPYIPGRFLDLSAGSAQALGLTGVGYIQAEIYR